MWHLAWHLGQMKLSCLQMCMSLTLGYMSLQKFYCSISVSLTAVKYIQNHSMESVALTHQYSVQTCTHTNLTCMYIHIYIVPIYLISNEWYTTIYISIEDHGTICTNECGIEWNKRGCVCIVVYLPSTYVPATNLALRSHMNSFSHLNKSQMYIYTKGAGFF